MLKWYGNLFNGRGIPLTAGRCVIQTENFLIAVRCVTPMFLTLCVGLLLRRARIVPDETFHHLSTISFRALLPCLMFYSVYSADLSSAIQPKLLLYLVLWVLGWFGLNYAFYTAAVPDPRRRGACIQNSFRSNIAVIGVSLAQPMTGQEGLAALAFAISVVVPLYNVLAVITLETCRGGTMDPKKTLGGILRNPLIIGCFLGLLFLFSGLRLPSPVEQAVKNLGSAGSVTTLLALGASFEFSGLAKNRKAITLCTLHRLVIAPLLALIAAILLGFRGDALGVILVCLASPTASAAYPMALACDSDHELTAHLVVITSLLCTFTLFCWIFFLKQLGFL